MCRILIGTACILWLCEGLSHGVPKEVLSQLLQFLPPKAPVVYLQWVEHMNSSAGGAILVATGPYSSAPGEKGEIFPAEFYIFTYDRDEWTLTFRTQRKKLLEERDRLGLVVRIRGVEIEDLDRDPEKEITVFWETWPLAMISGWQLKTEVTVIDRDAADNNFVEICHPDFVFLSLTEKMLLLNVDCDYEKEIVMLKEVMNIPEYCIACAKPYRIEVWTLRNGRIIRDPDWNEGHILQTQEYMTLYDEGIWGSPAPYCDLTRVLKLIYQYSLSPYVLKMTKE